MKPILYECHITMLGNAAEIELAVTKTNWHFSKIDGDPVLGSGVKCYATINYNKNEMLLADCISEMETLAGRFSAQGIRIVRTKVEEIVYDRRL